MMSTRALFVLGLIAAACAGPASAATPLQHDIFARPPLETLKPQAAQPVKPVTPAPPPPEWKPELRAIISGGGTALVNVEGRILQIGQDMDGYRLVEVQERRAVFVKDKVRYTLNLGDVKGASAPAAPVAAPTAAPPVVPAPAPAAVPAPAPAVIPPPALTPAPSGFGTVKTSDLINKGASGSDSRAMTFDRRGG